jgi:putative acetyltransferase
MQEEEPFLKRWSRRKTAARDGAVAPAPTGSAPAPPPPAAGPAPEDAAGHAGGAPLRESAADAGAEEGTPAAADLDVDFEALDFQSDYSRFLAPDVPEAIKNKALRKLWASSPIFTAADPFQDYQGDYTDAALGVPPGTLATAYRIGRGFMSDEELAAWQALSQPAAAVAEAAGPTSVAPALNADRPDLEALLRQAAAHGAEGGGGKGSEHLAAPSANVRHFLARRDGAPVGCGALFLAEDGAAEVRALFVVPAARGAKIGEQILAVLEEAAAAAGAHVIRIWIGAGGRQAQALCRRRGYTGREPPPPHGDAACATLLAKGLP